MRIENRGPKNILPMLHGQNNNTIRRRKKQTDSHENLRGKSRKVKK